MMRTTLLFGALLLACSARPLASLPRREGRLALDALAQVETSSLNIESGHIGLAGRAKRPVAHLFYIRSAAVRMVVPDTDGSIGKVVFAYQGPSDDAAPLASGELRRQIGLKLRAKDACNVVYVMWHLEPTAGVFVQVKANPGLRTSKQCRDRGYQTLKADRVHSVPALRIGESHSLAAYIDAGRLHVLADDRDVWEGALPKEAEEFEGPIGVRTDNGRFSVEVYALPPRHSTNRSAAGASSILSQASPNPVSTRE